MTENLKLSIYYLFQRAKNSKKRKFHEYPQENLQKAVDAIRQGVKIREASRNYGVPRAIIQDRLKGRVRVDKSRRMGPDPFLSVENEEKIVQWVINIAKCGFPIKKNELINTVQKIVVDGNIKTPFKDNRPGQKWYASFLKRHPEVSARSAESVDKSRGKLTKEYIQSWFRELEIYLESIDATDVLNDPTRVFNADESGFSLCPKTGKVLAPKGYKKLYEVKKGSEKENVTVLVTFSADGKICPPCVVYPYVKPPRAIADNMPEDWILGKSDTGWMRADVFYEYVANGLHQWIMEHNIKKPILFFVDGHRSHMSVELSRFCDENGIILYALPPNSTHMMQPADVAVFKPLKEYWRQAVRSWQSENEDKTLTKVYFASVFKRALENPKISEHIKNGFRRCGLYPCDMEAVDYSKCIQNTLENINNNDDGNGTNEQEVLTPSDFKSAHKVLMGLKSNLTHRTVDVDKILSELKKFEESLQDQPEEIVVEDENLAIEEYEVNNDGFLSLVPTNEPNILPDEELEESGSRNPLTTPHGELGPATERAESFAPPTDDYDILNEIKLLEEPTPHGKFVPDDDIFLNKLPKEITSNKELVSTAERAESPFIPTNNDSSDSKLLEETTSNEELVPVVAEKAESSFIPTNEPKLKILRVDILRKGNKGKSANKECVSAFENVEATSEVAILSDDDKGTMANEEVVAATVNANWSLILENKPKIKILSAFEKHLTYPKPILKSKRTKSGPTTSAISAKAWRTYYISKEMEKEEQEKIKERKRELAKRKKSENLMGGKKKRKAKQNKISEELKTALVARIKQKCGSCQDELDSDAEEDCDKNIGCDTCPRWFHLKCTKLAGQAYEDAMNLDFYCNLCT